MKGCAVVGLGATRLSDTTLKGKEMGRRVVVLSMAFVLLCVAAFVCPKKVCASDYPAAVSEYLRFLKTLDKSDPASVDKAVERYVTLIASRKKSVCDQGFVEFLRFYSEVCDTVTLSIDKKFLELSRSSEQDKGAQQFIQARDAEIRRYGMRLDSTEGVWIIAQLPEYIAHAFRPYVSKAVQDYLEIRGKELDRLFVDDGAITIPAEEIGTRLAVWERHLARFRHSALRKDAVFLYRMYIKAFLTADGYTDPLGEICTDKSSLPNAWRTYIKDHAGTKSAEILAGYLDICGREGFRHTLAVDKYLEKLDTYLDSLGKGPTHAIYLQCYYGVVK